METKALTSRKEVRALASTSFLDHTWVRTKTKELKSFTGHVNAVDHNIKGIHVGNVLAIACYYTARRVGRYLGGMRARKGEEPHREISEKVGLSWLDLSIYEDQETGSP